MGNFVHNVATLKKVGVLAMAAVCLAGCVVEPYPPPQPAPVAMAPGYAPGYYAQPCCYSYYEYPPAYYGPNVGLGFNFGGGGWGGRRWR